MGWGWGWGWEWEGERDAARNVAMYCVQYHISTQQCGPLHRSVKRCVCATHICAWNLQSENFRIESFRIGNFPVSGT